ncbi:MAG: hypothetical protein JWM11_7482 [Planctomycetaceae bacterium]|nr:hypothetical protein [Planctomycetaceae bacterium]
MLIAHTQKRLPVSTLAVRLSRVNRLLRTRILNNRRRLKAAQKSHSFDAEMLKLLRQVSASTSVRFQEKLDEVIQQQLPPNVPHAKSPLKLVVAPGFEQYMRPEFETELTACFQEAVKSAILCEQE